MAEPVAPPSQHHDPEHRVAPHRVVVPDPLTGEGRSLLEAQEATRASILTGVVVTIPAAERRLLSTAIAKPGA